MKVTLQNAATAVAYTIANSAKNAVMNNPKTTVVTGLAMTVLAGIGAAFRVSANNKAADKKAQPLNLIQLNDRIKVINAKLAKANEAKDGSKAQNELKDEAMKLLAELNKFAAKIDKGQYAIGGQKVSAGGVTGFFGKTKDAFVLVTV